MVVVDWEFSFSLVGAGTTIEVLLFSFSSLTLVFTQSLFMLRLLLPLLQFEFDRERPSLMLGIWRDSNRDLPLCKLSTHVSLLSELLFLVDSNRKVLLSRLLNSVPKTQKNIKLVEQASTIKKLLIGIKFSIQSSIPTWSITFITTASMLHAINVITIPKSIPASWMSSDMSWWRVMLGERELRRLRCILVCRWKDK